MMNDQRKTKRELIEELAQQREEVKAYREELDALKQSVAETKASEEESAWNRVRELESLLSSCQQQLAQSRKESEERRCALEDALYACKTGHARCMDELEEARKSAAGIAPLRGQLADAKRARRQDQEQLRRLVAQLINERARHPEKSGSAKKAKVKAKDRMPTSRLLAYLSQLSDALREGAATINIGERSVALCPTADICVATRAIHKGDEQKLKIALEWAQDELSIDSLKIEEDTILENTVNAKGGIQ